MMKVVCTSVLNARIGRQFQVAGETPQETADPPKCVRRCLQGIKVANGSPHAQSAMAKALDEWYEVEDWEDHSNWGESCT